MGLATVYCGLLVDLIVPSVYCVAVATARVISAVVVVLGDWNA